jgi:hypothetical protein
MTELADDLDVPAEIRRELMDAAVAKQISYAWLCGLYRAGLLAGRAMTIGETGAYPYGKLGADDEGELAVAVAADPQHGVVRLEFGKSIAWLALPAGHARQFADVLRGKADELDRKAN